MRQVSIHFKHTLIIVTAFPRRKWQTLAHHWPDTALAVATLVCEAESGMTLTLEHVAVPDTHERLRRAYALILRAAARAGEQAEEGSTGECLDGDAKTDVSGKGAADG